MTASTLLMGLAAIAAPAQAAPASADLVGAWESRIAVGGQSIRVVFRLLPDGTALMDSPDQGARGLAAEAPVVENGVVRIAVPAIGGRFEGRLSDDRQTLTGALTQGGMSVPVVLQRGVLEQTTSARPQTPHPPFAYRSQDVAFDNPAAPGVRLAGTLTLPRGDGPFPAVVLITGSGPQDRDETILDHKPFAVWADALTKRGVAVLRYDDRGTGASTGDFAAATSADFATDARAALDWLGERPEIDRARIGLFGHSEGATIAPLVVQNGGGAAWIVMLAGPAVSGGDILIGQQRSLASAAGQTAEAIEAGAVHQREIMAAVARNAQDGEATRREVEALLVAAGAPQSVAASSARSVSTPWVRWFVAHDPAASLEAARVPLLAVYGGKDLNVPAAQNVPVLTRLRPDADIVVLPGLNHLMQTAVTGLPTEYGDIEETLAPQAITTVVDWIVARSGR